MISRRKKGEDSHCDQWVLLAQESAVEAPEKADCGPVFTKLRNPKTGNAALYFFNSGASQVYEVKAFDEEYRSWFIGQSVQHDGRLLFVTPLDPLFLILPYLIQASEKQGKFQPVDQVIKDEDFPRCSNILNCTRTLQSLHHVTDKKEIGNQKFYKYNREKTLVWLRKKAEQTVKALKSTYLSVGGGVQSSMLIRNKQVTEVTEEDYLRYAHGLLSDYIPVDLSTEFLKFLELPAVSTKLAVSEPPSKVAAQRRPRKKTTVFGARQRSRCFNVQQCPYFVAGRLTRSIPHKHQPRDIQMDVRVKGEQYRQYI
ncbi:ribonuclease H2 subunit B isoform X2 [Heterodontus francisci]|uniref:ribonuclease H2 subunit B isoform X2 n=1 Tax=Heterodontus francisci TaxID=7792 RepID=UPI00355B8BA9